MRALLLALLVFGGPVAGWSQSSQPFITLEAASKSQGNTAETAWATDWGSYDVTFRQSVNIGVRVHNMSRAAAKQLFRVTFFARAATGGGKYVFSSAEQVLTLQPNQELAAILPSPLMQRRDQNYQALGVRYQEGSKYEGWLVQVFSEDGKILNRQLGSTSYLEDLAKTPAFAAMMDDYRKNAKKD